MDGSPNLALSPVPAPAPQTNVADEAQGVQDVTVDLPTAFKYRAEEYYVRKAYSSYYVRVIELLQTYDYISVTGTPGIGKSIFYDYFFSRYRNEHPEAIIVTASFNKDRGLMKCVVFGPDGSSMIWDNTDFPNIGKRIPNAIHLYDGPPFVPPADSKMVTFTSPNFGWLDSMRKNVEAHCELYMPVWELGELGDAVKVLNLEISDEELTERYRQFGGVPRYCLAKSARAYRKGLIDMEQAIEKIKTLEDVQACFEMSVPLNLVVHRLLHYIPEEDPTFATLEFGSDWIGIRVYNQLAVKLSQERAKLMKWLDGAGKASTFNGWLFENLVHEKFLEGDTFKYAQLDEPKQEKSLTINKTMGHYERFATNFTLEMVFQNVYQIPISQTFKSIDSFIHLDHTLLLFQITKSMNHPVDCAGLVELFAKLELVDKIKQNPRFAQLIFVVPQGMGGSYKNQQLISQNLRLEDLMGAGVR
ncbi:unnamed protein product, partial [Aphanomyces euteiches]